MATPDRSSDTIATSRAENAGSSRRPLDARKLLLMAQTLPPKKKGAWQPPEPEELSGQFPNFNIVELLGSGGMGAVYRAWDQTLERWVALKILPPSFAYDMELTDRFQREAKLLARLKHRNVVGIHDFGATPAGLAYFVMELVEGSDLAQEMKLNGALPLDRTAQIFGQVCDAVAAAHAAGIMHRDLKPANVFLDSEGWVKVGDFGLAKKLTGDDYEEVMAGGTPVYMAPEQEKSAGDQRSDIYSLGVLLYELLTGEKPDPSGRPPSHVAPVNPQLDDIVSHAMQHDPARRFQTVAELKTAFFRAVGAPSALRSPDGSRTATLLFAEICQGTAASAGAANVSGNSTPPRAAWLAEAFAALLPGSGGRLVESSSRRLNAEFPTCSAATRVALRLQWLMRTQSGDPVRVGLHSGEVQSIKDPASGREMPAGNAVALAARIMALAQPGQILMTRHVFAEAQQYLRQHPEPENGPGAPPPPPLAFLFHGRYRFSGPGSPPGDDPVDVCEVGAQGLAPLRPPPDSTDVVRVLNADESETLGWRPAVTQEIPGRSGWVLERRLGEGGFGEAWLARCAETDEERVFKFCFDTESLRSFRREEKLFALLQNVLGERPDIAEILSTQQRQRPYFIESRFYPEGNLLQWAERQGGLAALPMQQRLSLMEQLCRTAGAAHAVGVIHKDIKPSNVLMRCGAQGSAHPILADFGIGTVADASVLDNVRSGQGGHSGMLFTPGQGARGGTPLYTAPEYLTGRPPSILGDVYALGVMLYQMVLGDPFRALAPGWEDDIEDELLESDIAAAVHGKVSLRLQSAEALADRLATLEERRARVKAEADERRRKVEELELAAHAAELRRRLVRTRKLVAGFAALSLAAIGAAIYGWHQQRQAGDARIVSENAASEAQQARAVAEESAQLAKSAKSKVEEHLEFLTDYLRDKLQPLGRLELLDDANQRVLAYFEDNPSAKTELAGGQALISAQMLQGDILLKRGEPSQAMEVYDNALINLTELIRQHRDQLKLGLTLARLKDRQGDAWQQIPDPRTAEACYAEARKLREEGLAVADDRNRKEWKRDLAFSWVKQGDMDEKAQRLEAALAAYSEAQRHYDDLASGDDTRVQRDQAFLYHKMGRVHETWPSAEPGLTHWTEAQTAYQRATEIFRQLSEDQPHDQDLKHAFSSAASDYGRSMTRDNATLAVTHLASAVETLEELVRHDPSNHEWQHDLAASRADLARAKAAQGRDEEAERAFLQSVALVEAITAKGQGNMQWREEAAQILADCAQLQLRRKNWDACRASLKRILNLADLPDNPDALRAAWMRHRVAARQTESQIMEGQKRFNDALEPLRQAGKLLDDRRDKTPAAERAEIDKMLADNSIRLARACLLARRFDERKTCEDKAKAHAASDTDVKYSMALFQLANSQADQARRTLDELNQKSAPIRGMSLQQALEFDVRAMEDAGYYVSRSLLSPLLAEKRPAGG